MSGEVASKSVTTTVSSSVLNMIEVKIEGEGHTLASALVERIEKDPECQFVAYKVKHPQDTFVTITIKGSERCNAKDVFKQALVRMSKDIDNLIYQVKGV